jgi:hypothetical protein
MNLLNLFPRSFFPRFLAAVFTAGFLSSCASVSVKNVRNSDQRRPVCKPACIEITPFSYQPDKVKENSTRSKKGELGAETQELLNRFLAEVLSKHIAPACVVRRPGKKAAKDVWLVSGRITRLEEGNRLLRMGIGLGAGRTRLDTEVEVRQQSMANRPFLRFSTTGGSNSAPGAATNPIPFSSVPTALLQTRTGITDDTARTARMINAALAQYLVKRGWLDATKAPKLKLARQ